MTVPTMDATRTSRFGDILNRRQPRPTAQVRNGRTDWYQIHNHDAGDAADIYIYDEIGYWGTTAQDFALALGGVTASQINLHINSPGGEVFDGVAIYNSLLQHPANVTTYIDGIAASAASFIAMAGSKVVMGRNATMMIHDASGICIGDANTMRTTGELLDMISDNIAGIYADKAGGTADSWRAVMQQTQWYNADSAVSAGLADEVAAMPANPPSVPSNVWDLSVFGFARADATPSATAEPVAPQPEPVAEATPVTPDAPPAVEPVAVETEPAPVDAAPEPVPAFTWDAELVRNALQATKHLLEEAVR